MIYCPDCGEENDDNAKFCDNCGRPLTDIHDSRAAMAAPSGMPGTARQSPSSTAPPPLMTAADGATSSVIADDGLPIGEDLDGEPGGERVLWKGRPSWLWSPRMAIMNRYKLTNERLVFEYGFIGRRTEEVDLYRVNDVSVKQHPLERLTRMGDVTVYMTDPSSPTKILHNISRQDHVKDMIREAARIERQRRRVLLREEMGTY
jgi:hypothetical protein